MPIFTQLSIICPNINDLQLATGFQNIEKWKIRADNEKRQKEKEDRLNEKLEAFRLVEMKSDIQSSSNSDSSRKS